MLVAVMVLSFWLLPSLDACPTAHEEDAGGAQQAASLAAATHHVLASTSSVTSYSTGASCAVFALSAIGLRMSYTLYP